MHTDTTATVTKRAPRSLRAAIESAIGKLTATVVDICVRRMLRGADHLVRDAACMDKVTAGPVATTRTVPGGSEPEKLW